jgi:hypothetical protein
VLIKATAASLYAAAVFTAFARRRIDLLNLCAGLTVVFACLWLDKGALNRMNIAMVFAVAALASLSMQTFTSFAVGMVLMGTVGYAVGIPILRLHLTTLDGIFTVVFLAAYLTALLTFDHSRASPARAAVQRT